MSAIPKWKKALQSSNILLEYEASKILSSAGFSVNSDYLYSYRDRDTGNTKESSVDIHAEAALPFGGQAGDLESGIDLIVECAHRPSGADWLFIPEPEETVKPEEGMGRAIRAMDQFSSYVVEQSAAVSFDLDMPVCRKGFEMDRETGDVSEESFRNELEKLRFVLPRILTDNVLFFLIAPPEKNVPFIIFPVLLTTADLYILKKDATAERIEEASEFREVADSVPVLAMHAGFGPGFEHQCMNECNRMKAVQRIERAATVEQKRARHFGERVNLPFTIMEAMISADRYYLETFFTRFVICGREHFPALIDDVKAVAGEVSKSRALIE